MRIAASLVLVSAVAGATPRYPAQVPVFPAHDREAAFRKANPQTWDLVVFDSDGYLQHANTTDAALVGADLAAIQSFVRSNAESFHIDDAHIGKLAATADGFAVSESIEGVPVGSLAFRHAKTTTGTPALFIEAHPFVAVPAVMAVDKVLRKVVGHPYDVTETFIEGSPPDCGLRGTACPQPRTKTVTRKLVVAEGDVKTTLALYRDGDSVRLVRCVALRHGKPPADYPHLTDPYTVTSTDKGAPALPVALDAVTGDVVTGPHCLKD